MSTSALHIDLQREATERDGFNTPPMLPDEPTWMTDMGGSTDGGGGGGGIVGGLGWRGIRRSNDVDKNGLRGGRTIV